MSARGKAVCSKALFRKGASHDITSSTHDRGYAGEESLFADPSHLRAAGLAVCTPFQQITGVTEVADCLDSGRSSEVFGQCAEHQASHDPDDLLRRRTARLGGDLTEGYRYRS